MPGGRAVLAPDGRMWKVGREWVPTTRVRLRRDREMPDFSDLPLGADIFGEGTVGGALAALAIVITGAVLLLIVWPVVALAIEIVILLVLFLAGLAGRFVFRRPWRIVARTKASRATLAWHVVGWRESGRAVDQIADALAAGDELPRAADRVLLGDPRYSRYRAAP